MGGGGKGLGWETYVVDVYVYVFVSLQTWISKKRKLCCICLISFGLSNIKVVRKFVWTRYPKSGSSMCFTAGFSLVPVHTAEIETCAWNNCFECFPAGCHEGRTREAPVPTMHCSRSKEPSWLPSYSWLWSNQWELLQGLFATQVRK